MSVKLAMATVLLAIVLPMGSQTPKHPGSHVVPEKSKLFKHHEIVAWSCTLSSLSTFVYVAGLAVDADGAYRAYHPADRLGLDAIVHAGYLGNWWALATDTGETNGRPVLQQRSDPAPGYYVSMTSLYDT